ncbi:hypothetical protein [Sphingomonas phyllosphaerae]|uniref:hypothetical protein n=1 Tax=Sphingomonas phyllosphaerae TaxID=257003 RepID=UPI0003B645A8|nr:hypothetical protein [Sphingomonas phyllosphaerae]
MTRLRSLLAATGLALAIGACVPRAVPPAPAPAPAPPPPAPPPVPAPVVADWQDRPWTSGAWRYRREANGSRASYAVAGGASRAELRCDRTQRALFLVVPGGVPGAFTIRTSAMTRAVATQVTTGATSGIAARFAADDRLLDAMAFTRGRFTIEQPGAAPLVLPPWAEVGRVIEDCRG